MSKLTFRRLLYALFGGVGVMAVLVVAYAVWFPDFESCDYTVRSEAPSPGGRYVAKAVQADCSLSNNIQMVFLARQGRRVRVPEDSFAAFQGEEPLVLTWRGKALVVSYGLADPFQPERPPYGVKVVYEGVAPIPAQGGR